MRWRMRGAGSYDEFVRLQVGGHTYELAVRNEVRFDWTSGRFLDEWFWLIDQFIESEDERETRATLERGSAPSKRAAKREVKAQARARGLLKRFDLGGAISLVLPKGELSVAEHKGGEVSVKGDKK